MLILPLLLTLSTAASPAHPLAAAAVVPQEEARSILLGRSERLTFERDVRRVSVANGDVLRSEVLDSREVLVSGTAVGVTALTIWFETGEPLERLFSVERDVRLLSDLLQEIDPAIEVEFAAESDFVVLRGLVRSAEVRDAAGATAAAFMGSPIALPVLSEDDSGSVDATPEGGKSGRRASRGSNVVNLLRVVASQVTLESRIEAAIAPLSEGEVTVRRIQVGDLPDDLNDVFVLDGTVPDQVTLTRILFLASRTVQGATGSSRNGGEVRALADEAGALTQARNLTNNGSGGGNQQQGLRSNNNSALGNGGQQQLANRISAQVGRAKIVEAAGGRLLSTIQVAYLPLVRVDVRLYEVNSSKLQTWRNELTVAQASFDQPGLLPSPEATALQGAAAPSVGDGDVQGLLGFLNGTLSGRGQAVSGGFAVDSFFQLLVEEEIAKNMSNPSLAVLSGELAQFQVGGQIPVPRAVTVGGGTDQILNSVDFRDYGIDLTVRPLVEERSSSRITLDVIPRISTPDLALTAAIGSATGQASAATAFESRATRTSARVYDGEALVIGGLSLARSQQGQSRTPILGSVPVIGWLFRNEADDDQESELVIVVTPSVIRERRPQADLWAFPSTREILERCRSNVSPPESTPESPQDGEPAEDDRHSTHPEEPAESTAPSETPLSDPPSEF